MTDDKPTFSDDSTTAEQFAAVVDAVRSKSDVKVTPDTRFRHNGNPLFEIGKPDKDKANVTVEIVEKDELYKIHFRPTNDATPITGEVDSWEDALIEAYQFHIQA